MTATDALAVIVAALVSTTGTAVVVRPGWSAKSKRLTALIIALVLGILAALIAGQISGVPGSVTAVVQQVVISAAAVVAAAQGFHRQMAGALGVLESATSPTVIEGELQPDAAPDPAAPEPDPDPIVDVIPEPVDVSALDDVEPAEVPSIPEHAADPE
jgi:hypothetical protein